jgi:hypothetical protein
VYVGWRGTGSPALDGNSKPRMNRDSHSLANASGTRIGHMVVNSSVFTRWLTNLIGATSLPHQLSVFRSCTRFPQQAAFLSRKPKNQLYNSMKLRNPWVGTRSPWGGTPPLPHVSVCMPLVAAGCPLHRLRSVVASLVLSPLPRVCPRDEASYGCHHRCSLATAPSFRPPFPFSSRQRSRSHGSTRLYTLRCLSPHLPGSLPLSHYPDTLCAMPSASFP